MFARSVSFAIYFIRGVILSKIQKKSAGITYGDRVPEDDSSFSQMGKYLLPSKVSLRCAGGRICGSVNLKILIKDREEDSYEKKYS